MLTRAGAHLCMSCWIQLGGVGPVFTADPTDQILDGLSCLVSVDNLALILSKSLGRHTWTSQPASSSVLIQSHWASLTTPLDAFNSTNMVPRAECVITRSGKPWSPVLGVIHLPGRICAGWVCMTFQRCNLAKVMTAFWNSASDGSATVHQPINDFGRFTLCGWCLTLVVLGSKHRQLFGCGSFTG